MVFGDAFNDVSVPYHLTTHEFNESVRRLLTPGGLDPAKVAMLGLFTVLFACAGAAHGDPASGQL